MTDYTPIDCGLHSEYELAMLHAKRLRISWCQSDGQLHVEVLQSRDLKSRDHEEYPVTDES